MKKIIVTIIFMLIITGCSSYCPAKEVEPALDEFDRIGNEWVDALDIAGSTSRISLAEPIASLQSIKRDLDDTDVPDCMLDMKAHFLKSMEFSIDGFLAFLQQEDDIVVKNKFATADIWLTNYIEERDRIINCYPNKCK